MSSIITHICISNVIKNKYGFSSKFIYGSILPDIEKKLTNNRTGSHYIKQICENGKIKNLPQIDDAISDLDFKENKEVNLGKIAHLVEDLIWFRDYIPNFASVKENKYIYSDDTVHSELNFRESVYKDYLETSAYVINKCNVDIESQIESLTKILSKDEILALEDNLKYVSKTDFNKVTFMKKECIDSYIKDTIEELEKVIGILLEENDG